MSRDQVRLAWEYAEAIREKRWDFNFFCGSCCVDFKTYNPSGKLWIMKVTRDNKNKQTA
jgi:hypothetical protein